jgi:pimeloyl-ACP methyl ester carboxylesterase
MTRRAGTTPASDGAAIAWERTGSDPIRFCLVHATGFCKETWRPVVDGMEGACTLALDQRGHGDSDPPDLPVDWWVLGRDVVSVSERFDRADAVVGVGHSSGGAAVAMAELVRPGTFAHLVLVEPIIFPPPYARAEDHPLAVGAERRRRDFDDESAVRAAYAGRPPFDRWDRRAFDAYAGHGFRSESGRWTLKCAPEIEAEFYRAAWVHGAWDRLAEIACPVTIVIGDASDSHPGDFAEMLANRFSSAEIRVFEETGHLVPMERPDQLAAVLLGI